MSTWTDGYVTDLSYTSGFYRELSPNQLSFAMTLKGVQGPDPSAPLRYCELGCGQGVSSNLLAAANPHIEFHSTDFNPGHIVGARALAREAGLANMHFYEHSFADFADEPALPELFDIISLHGIYSWITAQNRQHIVDFISRKLGPGGIVYISYNCLPGWSAAAPMRHLMYLRGRDVGGPTARRLQPALDMVQSLIDVEANYFRSNPLLKERFDKMRGLQHNYLAHEYLNDVWTLLYHADVAAELSQAKLNFVGSVHVLDELDSFTVTEAQAKILRETSDPILRETLKDYITNQQFRRDVFAKGASQFSALKGHEIWRGMRIALIVPRASAVLKVRGLRGEMTLQADIVTPLLDALAPGPKTVAELLADPMLSGLGAGRIQQAIAVLIGSNQASLCLSTETEVGARKSAQAYNSAVFERARYTSELVNLASPVTGGGVSVDRTQLLFLLGMQSNAPDLPQFAWQTLQSQGQRLMKDGAPIAEADDNVAELKERYDKFAAEILPLLQQLGCV